MLVEKMQDYLTGTNLSVDEDLLDRCKDVVANAVRRQFMEKRGVGKKLGGSNPGPCPRRIAYAFLGFDESKAPDARARFVWMAGDILEVAAIAVMKLSGIVVTDSALDPSGQLEGFFRAGSLLVPCHADGKIQPSIGVTDEPLLLEIKSSADHTFKSEWIRGIIGDQYALQHQVYLETFDLEHGVILVINKNTGHFHEVHTSKDPDFIAWAAKNYKLAAGSDPDNLPPRFSDGKNYGRLRDKDGSPTTKLAWGCRYCPFMYHCWPGATMAFAKNTVECTVPITENETYVTRFGLKQGETLGFDL